MIKLHEFPKAVDYHELVDLVNSENNVKLTDYAGRHAAERRGFEASLKEEYLSINHPELIQELFTLSGDYSKDSPEMRARIKINTILREYSDIIDDKINIKYPYQNYWHYLLNDCCFEKGINYISLHSAPEPWIQEIHDMIIKLVQHSEAYDPVEQTLCCWVDW